MVKILIIEDDLDLIEMYKIQLEASGIEVFTADNLKKGFELAKKEKPDVILLDLLLSQKEVIEDNNDRGGYILLSRLQADKETKNIKIVILSNLDTQEDRREAAKRGACEYLIKSEVVPKDIVDLMNRIVKGGYKLQEKF